MVVAHLLMLEHFVMAVHGNLMCGDIVTVSGKCWWSASFVGRRRRCRRKFARKWVEKLVPETFVEIILVGVGVGTSCCAMAAKI